MEKLKAGVVAFAFGSPWSIPPNRNIAKIAIVKAGEIGGPIFTQRDVRIQAKIAVSYAKEMPGQPPPSLRIAREAAVWARREGISRLWVVAAKPHLWWCLRDLKYALKEAGVYAELSVCREIEQYPEDSWFCVDSEQKRTRSLKAFKSREMILKLMPMFFYRKVAS